MTDQNSKLKKDVLKWVIIGLGGFIILVLVFGTGMKVGALKARYSYRWAENYHRNFAGPRGGFFSDWRNFPQGEFINAHGTFGTIISIDGNALAVQGQDNTEKTILVSEATAISRGKKIIKPADLKVDDKITIIGSPNEQGQIEAKLIRVFR